MEGGAPVPGVTSVGVDALGDALPQRRLVAATSGAPQLFDSLGVAVSLPPRLAVSLRGRAAAHGAKYRVVVLRERRWLMMMMFVLNYKCIRC